MGSGFGIGNDQLSELFVRGGFVMWAIAALSLLAVAIILWKLWQLALNGTWTKVRVERAISAWQGGQARSAFARVNGRRGFRAQFARAAMRTRLEVTLNDATAREETTRIAKGLLTQARTGQRTLELIAVIAPLLGLLGTVIGMIAAFQALQATGARADPAALAGGIWQALLTTAAGMAVAIPASLAAGLFDAATERLQGDLEDIATRIFARPAAVSPNALKPEAVA